MREAFDEPSWNNPVVRFLSPEEKPVASRISSDWSLHRLASSMCKALEGDKKSVPGYLSLLANETVPDDKIEVAIFGMA